MIPDEYYIQTFNNLERIQGYKWYRIPDDRPDRVDLIEAIKKRIEMYEDFIFNADYTEFRRVPPSKATTDKIFTFEFWKDEELPPYEPRTDLPVVKPKPYDSKKFKQALGRT